MESEAGSTNGVPDSPWHGRCSRAAERDFCSGWEGHNPGAEVFDPVLRTILHVADVPPKEYVVEIEAEVPGSNAVTSPGPFTIREQFWNGRSN